MFYSNMALSVSFMRYSVSVSKNIATLKSWSRVNQGHWMWYHSIDYGFLLVFYSNFVPNIQRFKDIRLLSIQWTWKPG